MFKETKFSATIFFKPEKNIRPRKYIYNNLNNFKAFAKKSGGWYFNVYGWYSKKFIERIYIE